ITSKTVSSPPISSMNPSSPFASSVRYRSSRTHHLPWAMFVTLNSAGSGGRETSSSGVTHLWARVVITLGGGAAGRAIMAFPRLGRTVAARDWGNMCVTHTLALVRLFCLGAEDIELSIDNVACHGAQAESVGPSVGAQEVKSLVHVERPQL